MNRDEVLANIIEFAAMAFNKNAADIKEDTKIAEELGVQSMQRIAMSSFVSRRLPVSSPDSMPAVSRQAQRMKVRSL